MIRARSVPLAFTLLVSRAHPTPPAAPAAPAPPSPPVAAPAHATPDANVPGDAASAVPDAAERKAIFDDLVAAVRKYNVFSEATRTNLGRRWEDDLPELEATFARADTPGALHEALFEFTNSLHDGHLSYQPKRQSERGDSLVLGFELTPDWHQGASQYRVTAVSDPAVTGLGLRPGDEVVSASGVAGSALTQTRALWSNANHWHGVAVDVAKRLTARNSLYTAVRVGDHEAWVVRHADGTLASLDLTWRKVPWPGRGDSNSPIAYTAEHCAPDLVDRHYPSSYRLSSHGRFYCLYTSTAAPYDAYPIVRHFAFWYSGVVQMLTEPRYIFPETRWDVAAEYFNLSRTLRDLGKGRVKGVILDLRDNFGGNDSAWFLDWYAPRSYIDMFTDVRVLPDFADAAFRSRIDNVGDDWYAWYEKAASGHPDGSFIRRPFQCATPDCTGDNRYTPAHGLIDAPVALVVGPTCGSSCAHFAQIFDENDFGPLVGESTGANLTSQRMQWPVKTRSGRELGTIRLAVSKDVSGKTGAPVEGVAVHIDAPVEYSYERRDDWDKDLVDAAVRAFHTFKFPKREAKLGP